MGKKNRNSRKKKYTALKKIFNVGMFLLVVLIITFVLNKYFIERVEVHNHSMEPTLYSGNIIMMDKHSYIKNSPKRYDIIIFDSESTTDRLIKRVIGLPGETVRIVQGKIYIDGENIKDIEGLDLPFDAGLAQKDFVLDENEYFVLGDNRKESIDSRFEEIGAVKKSDIKGKLLFRLKPISGFWVK